MKITQADYNTLEEGIKRAIRDTQHNMSGWFALNRRNGGNDERTRWNLYHHMHTHRYVRLKLYTYLNDSHIDTALREITNSN